MKMPRSRLVIPLVAVAALGLVFRELLRELIRNKATLANDAPNFEVVADMIEQAADSSAREALRCSRP